MFCQDRFPAFGFRTWLAAIALIGAFGAQPTRAQEAALAFTNAIVIPIAGEPITNGVLVIQRGKIVAIGPKGTAIPAGAIMRDASGKVIMPGLVDTHSHIGAPAGGDASAPIQPDTRVLDAIDVRDSSIQ